MNQSDKLGCPERGANGETLRGLGVDGQYRASSPVAGIYLITNLVNGKRYVGASVDVVRRLQEHRTPKNIRKRTVLARAFRRYGTENFTFALLEKVDPSLLPAREVYWIADLKPEYNMNEGGLGNPGRRVSEKTRAILSAKAKLQWERKSDDEKRRVLDTQLCPPRVGHPVKVETREKLRRAQTGKKMSAAARSALSASQKVSMLGNQNGNKAIVAVSKDGSVVARYPSTRAAALAVGVNPTCISGVLKKRRKTSGGFCWEYWTESVETIGDECTRVGAEIVPPPSAQQPDGRLKR